MLDSCCREIFLSSVKKKVSSEEQEPRNTALRLYSRLLERSLAKLSIILSYYISIMVDLGCCYIMIRQNCCLFSPITGMNIDNVRFRKCWNITFLPVAFSISI